MSPGSLLLWALTALAGASLVGLVQAPLRLEERVALGAVAGMVGGSVVTLLLSLGLGLGLASVLLGPGLLGAGVLAAAAASPVVRPLQGWRQSAGELRGRVRGAELWATLAVAALALVGFALLFAHTLFERSGAILAGYNTVWADWSLHSTLASSFARADNLPPHDPVFSGSVLLYPFLPDFHAAVLQVAGASLPASLALPQVVLCTAVTILVVSLARRLCGSVAVGAVALLLCVGGGGLGFTGVVWDACRSTDAGAAQPQQCTVSGLAADASLRRATVAQVPTTVAHMEQTRSYDNLLSGQERSLGSSYQWYTPLLAWWLPQRTFVWGFAVGLSVLLLVVAALRAPPRSSAARGAMLGAGLLAGTLPLMHIHSLIALAVVLGLLALRVRRWRDWAWLAVPCAGLAAPRLAEVLAGPHGAPAACTGDVVVGGTNFPYLEPGWLYSHSDVVASAAGGCYQPGRFDAGLLGALRALPAVLRLAVDPGFWGFWVANTGPLVVVCLVVALALGLRRLPAVRRGRGGVGVLADAPRRLAVRVLGALPAELVRFCLPFLAIFVVANIVVFQEWDWDNTKLLAWWYLGAALLTAAWLVRWWRSGLLRALLATLAALILLLSGALSLGRVAQTEARGVGGGPYIWASGADRRLAADVEARTPLHAVVLTHSRPTDPLSTLAGRAALLGYPGWLISYGIVLGERPDAARVIFAGCTGEPRCPIPGLLRSYHVDYVEVEAGDSGAAWFAATYPVAARSENGAVTVYDVRRP